MRRLALAVLAMFGLGAATAAATVTIKLIQPEGADLGPTAATVKWTGANKGMVAYFLLFRQVGDTTWQKVGPLPLNGNATSLGNLTPNTGYEVEIQVLTVKETGGPVAFTTKP